jgi:hypothetical protein
LRSDLLGYGLPPEIVAAPLRQDPLLPAFPDHPVLAGVCMRTILVSKKIQWRIETSSLIGASEGDLIEHQVA